MSEVPALIDISHVDKHFGRFQALEDVSGVVRAGEVVVICGLSGSGKSTLIRTVNGLEPITRGRIVVDGQDVHARATNLNLLRRKIGFVFQQYNLFPHLTAQDNVALGLYRLMRLPRAQANARAMELLARVGLAHRPHYLPADLSGGEQQRVAIARALAMKPSIILFDEPTSALDPEVVGEVLKVIRSLTADGMTMMCVTHEMGFAREVADWIWFMEAGRVVERARPEAFFAAPSHAGARQFIASLQRGHA